MEEKKTKEHFYKCPFCSNIFVTKVDLERHMSAFGTDKGQHMEKHRRRHTGSESSLEE
jgi:uncharacterized C2H2 Zn-finger protein